MRKVAEGIPEEDWCTLENMQSGGSIIVGGVPARTLRRDQLLAALYMATQPQEETVERLFPKKKSMPKVEKEVFEEDPDEYTTL